MKLIYLTDNPSKETVLYKRIVHAVNGFKEWSASVVPVDYRTDKEFENATALIVGIENEESYRLSLQFIQEKIKDIQLPFMCLSTHPGKLNWDEMRRHEPEKLLLQLNTEKELKAEIKGFLSQIHDKDYTPNRPKDSFIWISPKRGVHQRVDLSTIKFIEAEDHYIRIHCEGQQLPLIKSTLGGFYNEKLANKGYFYFLNRSCIINTRKVVKIENHQLIIDPGKPLSIPKGKKEEVLKVVGI